MYIFNINNIDILMMEENVSKYLSISFWTYLSIYLSMKQVHIGLPGINIVSINILMRLFVTPYQ